ncbi:MAG: zinc-dependent peptidase lipoprotein, family [Deltaproteobacteria bacterium]|nr:zinc-dependent peptidase lipoprotein, family [Deltaproteobacteria bacterium]
MLHRRDGKHVMAAAALRLAVLLFAALSACKPPLLPSPADMVFQPVRFSFPQADRVQLSNGMVLYLREDHELPLLNLVALIRTGAVYEPEDKLGLASLTGTVMRTGGTSALSGDEINEQLEFIAASMETGISREAGSASLSVLSKDREIGFRIFADVLMHPVFAQDKVDLAKKKELEAIRRRNDDPQDIAFREFRRTLFRDNPRGRVPTLKTVSAVTREDMIAFHRTYVRPNTMILGVSGDFKREEMIGTIERLFAGWEPAGVDMPSIPVQEAPAKTHILYARPSGKGIPIFSPSRCSTLYWVTGASGPASCRKCAPAGVWPTAWEAFIIPRRIMASLPPTALPSQDPPWNPSGSCRTS